MSGSFLISRRAFLAGLAGAIGLRALPGLADETPPSDRGIGGTGITGLPGPGGAIGFLGSIQRFGSIYVNGERIAYADGVAVTIDGQARRPRDLIIGQVVKTVATRHGGTLSTDRIDVTSEVIGPVEQLDGDSMTVLGQRVALGTTGTRDFALGERLAVSGIRRTDNTIVARLVEPAGNRPDQVVGVALFQGWTLRIGALQLLGPDARYDGRRVIVRGRRVANGLMVTSIALDRLPDGAGVATLSIEAYVARHGNAVQLGSGVVLNSPDSSIAPGVGNQPAFVSIDLGSVAKGGGGGTAVGGNDGMARQPLRGPGGKLGAPGHPAGVPAPMPPSGGRAGMSLPPGLAAGPVSWRTPLGNSQLRPAGKP